MEKMGATIVYWGTIGIAEKENGCYRDWGYIGIMEMKVEAAIVGSDMLRGQVQPC